MKRLGLNLGPINRQRNIGEAHQETEDIMISMGQESFQMPVQIFPWYVDDPVFEHSIEPA